MNIDGVAIIEDHQSTARAWARALGDAGYVADVAGSVRAARELLFEAEQRERSNYVAVLLDLRLPDGHGSALVQRIVALRPAPAIVVVSSYLDATSSLELMGSCDWLIPKPASRELVVEVVRRARTGPREVVVRRFAELYRLSPSETLLLGAAARGCDNKSVCQLLGCRRGTVTTYWKRIFRKTRMSSQRDVVGLLFRFSCREGTPAAKA